MGPIQAVAVCGARKNFGLGLTIEIWHVAVSKKISTDTKATGIGLGHAPHYHCEKIEFC